MTNWLERERERRERAEWDAIHAEFQRSVENHGVPDTREAWRAFVRGWFGNYAYKEAQRDLIQAGQPSYSFAMLCMLVGLCLIGLPVMSYFTVPHENLNLDAVLWMIAIGHGFLILTYILSRRVRRAEKAQVEKHQKKWGYVHVEKPVDQ